jgi:hypothetical protein
MVSVSLSVEFVSRLLCNSLPLRGGSRGHHRAALAGLHCFAMHGQPVEAATPGQRGGGRFDRLAAATLR